MSETLEIHEADVLQRQATHLIGTLGHVSEGKSTLIRSLTGIKTQRHAKEQERNITIHLGYANCRVYQHQETGELRAIQTKDVALEAPWQLTAHLSFVDCPGHEAFLATMLGGASIMDTACLIIAANQEVIPQPQSVEHLNAATMMGLERLAVIQNKLDLLTEEQVYTAAGKINAFLSGTIAEAAPRIPISAQHGWGVNRVLEWIMGLTPPARNLDAPARLTCVRSFDVNRPCRVTAETDLAGAVIGGTLDQGVLCVGDWLEVRPGILKRGAGGQIVAQPIYTRVRGIRCEATELPYAIPGSLIAIATDLDPGLSIANGMVGQRVGVPGTLPPIVSEIQIRFAALRRTKHVFEPHEVGCRVRVCSNVMTVDATVTKIAKGRLSLRLDRPLCLGVDERIGLLRYHPEAGHEILDGVGLVRAVMPCFTVEDPEAAPFVVPDRRVVWVPMERPEWSARPVPAYTDLVSAVLANQESKTDARLRLPPLEITRAPKHTILVTWPSIIAKLDIGVGDITYEMHLKEWLEGELQTTSSVQGSGVLDMRGFWKADDLSDLIRRYVSQFKQCKQCKGYATGLVKERVLKVRCNRCGTDNAIDS